LEYRDLIIDAHRGGGEEGIRGYDEGHNTGEFSNTIKNKI
jgi:hypothetical protein